MKEKGFFSPPSRVRKSWKQFLFTKVNKKVVAIEVITAYIANYFIENNKKKDMVKIFVTCNTNNIQQYAVLTTFLAESSK